MVGREVVRELLFESLDATASAKALSKALSLAREGLSALGEEVPELLIADRAHIWISPHAGVDIDLVAHEKALRSALALGPGSVRDAALCAALAETRVLLQDEPYADWALRPREALELLRHKARLELARDRSGGHGMSEPEAVIEAWEAVLASEPASEEAAAALMRAYASQGQRHLVVRTYQRCRAGLEELGLDGSPALEEVHDGASLEATLRSLDRSAPADNLPGYPSTFIGREAELAEVSWLVESSRLVTLTGAAGCGKTRLAVEVARRPTGRDPEAVFFADLATIAEGRQVPGVVAAALGIRERAGRPVAELLVEVLADQGLLIVLDNCEHVVDACAWLADRLHRGCPKLHLLATSREPLGIDGERVYRVPSLSLTAEGAGTLQEIEGSDAVKLFMERARAHDPTVALDGTVAPLADSICRQLDGMPFAIELAAARLATMSLVHLAERLDQRFRLLTGGARTALPRQRTLQATVDWSFELLSWPEQAVLCRLSVFTGGFELDAAEAVCAVEPVTSFEVANLLGSLVSKSLVVAERSSGSLRYRLLETIRQYGAERLAGPGRETEALEARNAHAAFYLGLGETAASGLIGRGQGQWFKRLDLEWDNIRAVFGFLFGETGRTEDLLRLGVALHRFIGSRGHLEPIAMLREALERPVPVPARLRARALGFTGHLVSYTLGIDSRLEMSAALQVCQQGLEMARTLDDPGLVAEALYLCAFPAHMRGERRQARLLGREALRIAKGVGDPRLISLALSCLAREESARDRNVYSAGIPHSRRSPRQPQESSSHTTT